MADNRTPLSVAGITIVHDAEGPIALPDSIAPGWDGSRVEAEPIRVHHVVADSSRGSLRPVANAGSALTRYFVDNNGDLAIEIPGRDAGQWHLLRTVRNGYEYVLEYPATHPASSVHWSWQRTMLMVALPLRQRGLVVHAAGFVLPGRVGVLCPGLPGDGKSTLARLVLAKPGSGVVGLSDDRVGVTAETDVLRLWGTPWNSSAGIRSSEDAPCSAIVFIRHGEGFNLSRISPSAALRRLLQTVVIPFWDKDATQFTLSVVDRMIRELPSFELAYSPSPTAGSAFVSMLLGAIRDA